MSRRSVSETRTSSLFLLLPPMSHRIGFSPVIVSLPPLQRHWWSPIVFAAVTPSAVPATRRCYQFLVSRPLYWRLWRLHGYERSWFKTASARCSSCRCASAPQVLVSSSHTLWPPLLASPSFCSMSTLRLGQLRWPLHVLVSVSPHPCWD